MQNMEMFDPSTESDLPSGSEPPPQNETSTEIKLPAGTPEINTDAKNSWLENMPDQEARTAAKFLLDNLHYVDFKEFVFTLKDCVEDLMEKLKGSEYAVVVPGDGPQGTNKSELWVSNLAQVATTNAPAGFVTNNKIFSYLKDHPDIRDLVFYDDASYSGERIASGLELIDLDLVSLIKPASPITPASPLTPDSPSQKVMHAHVVVPFASDQAVTNINELYEYDNLVPEIIIGKKIPTITDLLEKEEPENAALIKTSLKKYFNIDLDDKDHKGICLTYFEHKLPDGWSFPSALTEGTVPDKDGKIVKMINFMPDIKRPYSI